MYALLFDKLFAHLGIPLNRHMNELRVHLIQFS